MRGHVGVVVTYIRGRVLERQVCKERVLLAVVPTPGRMPVPAHYAAPTSGLKGGAILGVVEHIREELPACEEGRGAGVLGVCMDGGGDPTLCGRNNKSKVTRSCKLLLHVTSTMHLRPALLLMQSPRTGMGRRRECLRTLCPVSP